MIGLAKALSDSVANGAQINLYNELFKRYHCALAKEHIINVDAKTLHADFVNDNRLSSNARELRRIFEENIKETNKSPNLWSELETKKLRMSETFGKTFELNPNPQITNVDDFTDAFFQLMHGSDKSIPISLENRKSKSRIIVENI